MKFKVFNPGSLPKGTTKEDLYRVHDSNPRNEVIALAMSWTSYVEKSGSGTGEIIDKCRDHGLATPIYDPTEGFFKTIIWRNGYGPAAKRAQVEWHSRMTLSKGTVRGPSQGPESGARVKSPSQKGPERAQKRAQEVLCQGTKSVPSQRAESRGRVKGPSCRAQSEGPRKGPERAQKIGLKGPERIVLFVRQKQEVSTSEVAECFGKARASGYLKRMLSALVEDCILETTSLKRERNRFQKYRLTAKGRRLAASLAKKKGRK